MVVAVGAAIAYSNTQAPVYEATTQVIIQQTGTQQILDSAADGVGALVGHVEIEVLGGGAGGIQQVGDGVVSDGGVAGDFPSQSGCG